MGNYLAKDFFTIFNTNPITIKCTTSPATAASITFYSISHAIKNAAREGRLIMTAIRDPFAAFFSGSLFWHVSSMSKLFTRCMQGIKI